MSPESCLSIICVSFSLAYKTERAPPTSSALNGTKGHENGWKSAGFLLRGQRRIFHPCSTQSQLIAFCLALLGYWVFRGHPGLSPVSLSYPPHIGGSALGSPGQGADLLFLCLVSVPLSVCVNFSPSRWSSLLQERLFVLRSHHYSRL